MDAQSEYDGNKEAAAAVAPVFKKIRREYIGTTPHIVRFDRAGGVGFLPLKEQ
jgi:hypothetical protein